MSNLLKAGDITLISFPYHNPQGREQEGVRPAIVICIPNSVRYPVVQVAPMTTKSGKWQKKNKNTYPLLKAGVGGLHTDSVVLLDQLRSVDLGRLGHYLGTVSDNDFKIIKQGLEQMCN